MRTRGKTNTASLFTVHWSCWKIRAHQFAQFVKFVCFRGERLSLYAFSSSCTCKMSHQQWCVLQQDMQPQWTAMSTHAVFASGPNLNKCWISGRVVSQCAVISSVSGSSLLRTSIPYKTVLCCINSVHYWSCKMYGNVDSIKQIKVVPNWAWMMWNEELCQHVQPSTNWLVLQHLLTLLADDCTQR